MRKAVEDIIAKAKMSKNHLEDMIKDGKTITEIAEQLAVSEGAVRKWRKDGLPADRKTSLMRCFVFDKITLAASAETQLHAIWPDRRTTADRLNAYGTLNAAELSEFKRLIASSGWREFGKKTRQEMLDMADSILGLQVRIPGTTEVRQNPSDCNH